VTGVYGPDAATTAPAPHAVLLVEIVPGLLRWTSPHPHWKGDAAPGSADDWEQDVGSVFYEVGDAVALIDPLLPANGRAGFLSWLDGRISRRPLSILTTIRWHRRDRGELAARYRAGTSRAWNAVPAGVERRPVPEAAETMFWLPAAATLVPGDALLGAGGSGLRLCPPSWLEGTRVDRARLAVLLRPLLELPIERVLVSHGEPVLRGGRHALARAIAEAEAA
jgi:hypothetical protein